MALGLLDKLRTNSDVDLDQEVVRTFDFRGQRAVELNDGIQAIEYDMPRAAKETGAYILSEALGFHCVPKTQIIINNQKKYARQVIYEENTSPQIDYTSKSRKEEIAALDIFDFIVARDDAQEYDNSPLAKNHIIIDGRIVLVDFEFAFDSPRSNVFHIEQVRGQQIPDYVIEGTKLFAEDTQLQEDVRARLSNSGLSELSIREVLERIEFLNSQFEDNRVTKITKKFISVVEQFVQSQNEKRRQPILT